MKLLFITIIIVVIYRNIVDNLIIEDATHLQILTAFQYIGSLSLILVLCLSVRDTVLSMIR
jgi:hypothetical protein